jgi:hypothetical protein
LEAALPSPFDLLQPSKTMPHHTTVSRNFLAISLNPLVEIYKPVN